MNTNGIGDIYCVNFSPNNKYLAIGLYGQCSIIDFSKKTYSNHTSIYMRIQFNVLFFSLMDNI